jgi:inosose dehydratase
VSRALDRVAGAPISWGVCEVPGWGYQLDPDRVLGEVAEIGLRATELGPEGYLPIDAASLRELLAAHGLALVAGFVPAVLHLEGALADELVRVEASADLLASGGATMLVLAAATGRDGYEGSAELDADAWSALARGIDRVVELAADRRLAVSLHPHVGTVVEGPHHVERLLEMSPVPLCVDTGHLMVGGSDPLELVRAVPERVAHVHLKDVNADLAEQVRAKGLTYHEAVRRGLYQPLGAGDLDVPELVGALERSGYGGWYVLEQDTVLEAEPERGTGPIRDARTSLASLERVIEEVNAAATG